MLLTNYRHKYNPNEIEKKEFLESFVVRKEIFEDIFNHIKNTDFSVPSQHFVIVGQRGQGKTTLLRKLYIEIEQDKELSSFLVPVQLAEEQYQVRSLCRLWEVIAEYLEDFYIDIFGNIAEMLEQHSENDDYDFKCFDYLEKEIKKQNKKIILLIDNIDELFGKLKEKETRQLREILLTSPNFKIVGGSTKMLEPHYDYSKDFYQFFKIIYLNGLNTDETIEFLKAIAKNEQKEKIQNLIQTQFGKIETLRQLTGGVPRTLCMLCDIFMDDDGNAFDDLVKVLDEATPLYKHRMDDLPPVLQDIVHTLALNWDGMLTKDIAIKTKLESKEASSQLKQLEKYRIVESVSIGKNKIYKIEERFFNIWYLMRFGRKKDRNRVEWLVKFLSTWYTPNELEDKCTQLISSMQNGKIKEHYLYNMQEALSYTGKLSTGSEHLLKLNTKKYFEKLKSDYTKDISSSDLEVLTEALRFYIANNFNGAINILKKSQKSSGYIQRLLGACYHSQCKYEKAEECYLQAINGGDNSILKILGNLYKNKKEYKKAEEYYLRAIESGDNSALNSLSRFYFLQSQNLVAALDTIEKSYNLGKDFYNTHIFATILLWNEEFAKSYEKFSEWLEYDNNEHSIEDISIYIILLIAKGQYYKAKEFFEIEKYKLKDKAKPIWYALMTLMQKEFPNEIKLMGSELTQSVNDVLKTIESFKQKYKIV